MCWSLYRDLFYKINNKIEFLNTANHGNVENEKDKQLKRIFF